MSVVRSLAWCFHILEMSSIHTGEHTNQATKDRKRQRLRYISQDDRLPLLSLFFFAGSYEKFSFRHEWFLISASLKVRPRTDDKDVSHDSCFSGFSRGVARIFPEVRETFSTSSPTNTPPPPTPFHAKSQHFLSIKGEVNGCKPKHFCC